MIGDLIGTADRPQIGRVVSLGRVPQVLFFALGSRSFKFVVEIRLC